MTDLPLRLARFGRALRAAGVPATLRDELDAAEALALVDREDREEVRRAARIALKVPRADFEAYDRLFDSFWRGTAEPPAAAPPPRRIVAGDLRGPALRWDPETRTLTSGPPGAPPPGGRPSYSPAPLLRRKRFDDQWSARDLARLEQVLARLARRLAAHRSRRWVSAPGRGRRVDVRRSYRRALGTGGELVRLAARRRALEEPRLAFVLDTSGSMDAHSRFLLAFALAVRRAVPRAEVFALNTGLAHLTLSLAPGKVRLSLDRMAAAVPDWSGGTRLGECLAAFHDRHLARWPAGRTVVVVLSDGLDRGDPARLADAVRRVQRRARRLLWLNPLLGDPGYRPATEGMLAALPFVDRFAPAHDLESLERLLPHLTG